MSNNRYITLGNCKIADSVKIYDGSVIGKKFRRYLDGSFEKDMTTTIEENVYIGYSCIIGNGSTIHSSSILDDNSIIESQVIIGQNNLIIYRAQICSYVSIEGNCVIGGFIGENTTVGNNCRIFGSIVHSQHNPLADWDADDSQEPAPTICDNVFIGFNAILSGGITVGPNAFVCAGSIITRDVPQGFIAHGTNSLTHYTKWKGKLNKSKLFI